MSGNIKKYNNDKGYESLNRNMLQDTENLSIDSIGLLAHLTSYPDNWKLYKTELYTRFAKSKRSKIESAWKELVKEKYIVQLRKRVGPTWEYIYYHNQQRFTDEDIKSIAEQEHAEIWDGKMSKRKQQSNTVTEESLDINVYPTVDFQQLESNSSKSTPNILTSKEINYKNKSLDNKDTKDTNMPNIKNHISNSLSEEQRLKEKELYMQTAYYENQDYVPERIAKMLQVFSDSTEQAKEYYQIILLAKKNAEIKTGYMIWLEHEPETEHQIINSFSRAVRKIEKERNIDNPKGYIYKAIYDYLIQEVGNRQRIQESARKDSKLNQDFTNYNWLEN